MIDDKKFCENPLIPDILKESQLFDSQIEEIVYRPIDNRSTPSVRTAIKTQPPKTSEISLQQRPKTPTNTSENILQITPPPESTQSHSSSLTFKTPPDDLPVRSDIQSSPTRQTFNEPGPSSTPISNLAKILAQKNRRKLNSKRYQAQLKYP